MDRLRTAPPQDGEGLRSPTLPRWPALFIDALLLVLIALGICFRFAWVDWHQGTNLHPDEYGLTNTISQLGLPDSFDGYFNTRLSPLSPYQKYDLQGSPAAQGPDNRLRWGQWPIIVIRAVAEMTGWTGYDEIRILGRRLSALADASALVLLYFTGRKLYGPRAGLLASALSALAVMQIQQSHFMTVDNFGVLFTSVAMYAAIQVAERSAFQRDGHLDGACAGRAGYRVRPARWLWYVAFGVAYGLAVASRLNLLPLGGIVVVASFVSIADLPLKTRRDLRRVLGFSGLLVAVSVLSAGITFRLTQPMSFRAPTGDTTLLTLHLNPEWVESMEVARNESSGIGGGPPSEQWANRPPIVYPLMNIVIWGMGPLLGIAAWAGFGWAASRLLRGGRGWRSGLLPLLWVGGYFAFMGTRFVKSMRYFLPIYPFLCLFAAWAIVQMWEHKRAPGGAPEARAAAGQPGRGRASLKVLIPFLASSGVVLGTVVWAVAFVRAVYVAEHARIRASRWIYEHVPAPLQITIASRGGRREQPIPAPDLLRVTRGSPYPIPFTAAFTGQLVEIVTAHADAGGGGSSSAAIAATVTSDQAGESPLDRASLEPAPSESGPYPDSLKGVFQGSEVRAGETYYLLLSSSDGEVMISRSAISNESWDEGLPLPIAGHDPFGQLYRGLTMEVRWYDDDKKREMFLENLARVDYIILPSQRSIWSTSRIPLTYPMTVEYYRALFEGRLGFDLMAAFSSPFRIGPLYISDVGGTVAWGEPPDLPVFNFNLFAAEEAFSVYDHPPVWIFKKRSRFDLAEVEEVLGSVDLSRVVIQSPREATTIPLD